MGTSPLSWRCFAKHRTEVRIAFNVTALFGPPRHELFAVSVEKNRARISGVSFATCLLPFAASHVASEVTWRRYCPIVCGDRPSASSWTRNAWRAAWTCMATMEPCDPAPAQGAFAEENATFGFRSERILLRETVGTWEVADDLPRPLRTRGSMLLPNARSLLAAVLLQAALSSQEPGGTIRVRLIDGKGGPIPEARIAARVTPADREARSCDLDWQLTTKDMQVGDPGTFLLTGVPLGDVTLFVAAPPFAPTSAESFEVVEGRPAEVTVRMRSGRLISGRVLDVRGDPVVGAKVEVIPEWCEAPFLATEPGGCAPVIGRGFGPLSVPLRMQRAEACSESDGSWRIAGMSSGSYLVVVRHDDFAVAQRACKIGSDPLHELPAVVLHQGASIEGRTLLDGHPIACCVSVCVEPLRGQEQVDGHTWAVIESDERGQFRLQKRLPAGLWTVSAYRPNSTYPFAVIVDRHRSKLTVTVRDDEQPALELNLYAK